MKVLPSAPHPCPSPPLRGGREEAHARLRAVVAAASLLLALPGCRGVQSALDSAGDDARRIEALSWVLFLGATAIFLLVVVLLLFAIYAPRERRRWLGGRGTIVVGGLVFPIVTLTALLIYGLVLLRVTNAGGGEPLRVEVIGEQYWWRVRYRDDGEASAFTTANEFHVPLGRPIEVSLASADVIHSFWIPNFAGKIDMIPGRINTLRFTAERPGVYRGVCTEFCGDQHARMAFDVAALDPAAFAAWREAQARDAERPETEFLRRGQALFIRNGCGNCHAVRGTEARGELGPDLTHVGSRRSIGAAQFPNNVGTLAGWIAGTQHLKPGARMPSYGSLSGEELRALAEYVGSLK